MVGSWIYNYLCNQCISPLMLRVRVSIRARCTTLYDKVGQWFATCRWISPGIPISSTNKINRHNITEILLKVALEHRQTNKQTNRHTFYRDRDHIVVGYSFTNTICPYHDLHCYFNSHHSLGVFDTTLCDEVCD